jgi:hypothetical protein
MLRWLAGCCLLLGVSFASGATPVAPTVPGNYAGELLQRLHKASPGLLSGTISAASPKSKTVVVVASTEAALNGSPADPLDTAALTSGTSAVVDEKNAVIIVRSPLQDVSGDPVGALRLTYAYHSKSDVTAAESDAAKVRSWLQRRISHAANLFDPVPYEPDAPTDTYAQQLVDEFLGKYPQIEILAIHATPPDSDYNIIAGSNIGRLGKKADNDDMRCVFTGKPNLEVNSTGKRFESEMQLHDRAGQLVGAVGVVVAYKKGDDKQALFTQADRIRVELEKRIPDAASLFRKATPAAAPAAAPSPRKAVTG